MRYRILRISECGLQLRLNRMAIVDLVSVKHERSSPKCGAGDYWRERAGERSLTYRALSYPTRRSRRAASPRRVEKIGGEKRGRLDGRNSQITLP